MTTTPEDPARAAFSRRAFLKGASVAAVTGSVAGTLPAADQARTAQVFGPGNHEIQLKINGQLRDVMVEPRTTLLDALRERLDITGAKKVCDRGACGACTMLVDGQPVNSCMMLAMDATGTEITTVESLSNGDQVDPLIQNFVDCDALQCGFCTPAMVMSAKACLNKHGKPTMDQIRRDMSGNICRCGTYTRIFEAIQRTANGVGGR